MHPTEPQLQEGECRPTVSTPTATSRPGHLIDEAIQLNLIVLAWLQDLPSSAAFAPSETSNSTSTEASIANSGPSLFHSVDASMPKDAPKTPQTGRRGRSRRGRKLAETDTDDTEGLPDSPTPRRPTARPTAQRVTRAASRGTDQGTQKRAPAGGREGEPSSSSSMLRDEEVVGAATTASSVSAYSKVFDRLPLRIGGSATPSLSTTSSQGGLGRRQRSPVKDVVDLRFAAKPIELGLARNAPAFPESVERLYNRLKEIKDGKNIIPASIEREVLARERELQGRETEISTDSMRNDSSGPAARKQFLAELEIMSDVVEQTVTAMLERCSEAHWNECVHGPMLRAAVGKANDPVVGSWNVTSARIAAKWIPQDSAGVDFQDRMVDYCIALSDKETRAASKAAVTRNMKALATERTRSSASETSSIASGESGALKPGSRKQPPVPRPSVNHIDYAPLRERPITVSIETKKSQISGDEALAQLSVWASSHLARLRYLFDDERGVVSMPLPLVQISGDTWQVHFAVDRDERIDILKAFDLQGTSTLLGCYKVFAMLQALRDWSSGPFRRWFLDSLDV